MKIELLKITVGDLTNGYCDESDKDDKGVVGYGGKLDIRPPYQREFVYSGKQREAVIDTALKGFPLNVMYWAVREDGRFEIIDGQQRTISLCQYVTSDFSYHGLYFHNLQKDERERFLNYELMVYLCEGSDTERLNWFEIINIAGVKLTDQELRNAVYHGPWLADAKPYFSRRNCPAYGLASDYMKGSPIRQDYLETAIKWISKGQIKDYMGRHQNDKSAEPLWTHFKAVIAWVETTFKVKRPAMKGLDWGKMYRNHKTDLLDPDVIEADIERLIADDEVQKKSGIYEFILTGAEHHLNIRAFSPSMRQKVYEKQNGICPQCNKEFKLTEMDADHKIPWHKGGKTDESNCQMLCRECNTRKGGK